MTCHPTYKLNDISSPETSVVGATAFRDSGGDSRVPGQTSPRESALLGVHRVMVVVVFLVAATG